MGGDAHLPGRFSFVWVHLRHGRCSPSADRIASRVRYSASVQAFRPTTDALRRIHRLRRLSADPTRTSLSSPESLFVVINLMSGVTPAISHAPPERRVCPATRVPSAPPK